MTALAYLMMFFGGCLFSEASDRHASKDLAGKNLYLTLAALCITGGILLNIII